jgi:membrane protein insertase Oxa1/YidC/SpoIIIJ
MLWRWGEGMPWLTRPEDYGGFLYLGPYLNLLPIIAVTLMIFQQKMMTPPPQDEQQEMQQKIMKYMMIFFGLLFYKVAAGLCIYFIASSVWGFAERRLLPKKKLSLGKISADAALQQMLAPAAAGASSTAVTGADAVTGVRGRKQGRNKKRQEVDKAAEGNGSAWSRFRKRLGAWWADMQKRADKK